MMQLFSGAVQCECVCVCLRNVSCRPPRIGRPHNALYYPTVYTQTVNGFLHCPLCNRKVIIYTHTHNILANNRVRLPENHIERCVRV